MTIAVPRGRSFRQAAVGAQPYLAVISRTEYAHRDDTDHYLTSLPVRLAQYEVVNDGRTDVFTLSYQAIAGTVQPEPQLLSLTVNYYDGAPYTGLPFGQVGNYGALTRAEALAITPTQLREAYRSQADVASPPEEPPYLALMQYPAWPTEYPAAFAAGTSPLTGTYITPVCQGRRTSRAITL